ncbi:MAG: hypothetical protein V3V08_00360 [Nannocystaceae bacterium]
MHTLAFLNRPTSPRHSRHRPSLRTQFGATSRAALSFLLSAACSIGSNLPHAPRPEDFEHPDAIDVRAIDILSAKADASPANVDSQFAAGMAHVHAVLKGHIRSQDQAEHYLERAFRLDPNAYPTARVLGRFLNMRNSVLDTSKIELQLELYRSLQHRGSDRPTFDIEDLSTLDFHTSSFLAANAALLDFGEGRKFVAWRKIRHLERDLRARTLAHPDEIDSFALAGTFVSTFAAALPLGRRRRARAAAAYFEAQQNRWHDMSPNAQDTPWAPNTRSVFMLALAETQLYLNFVDQARATYERLLALDATPTAVRGQLLVVARHRLDHLQRYAGRPALLPPWPNGATSCVACHARHTLLPTTDLHMDAMLAP